MEMTKSHDDGTGHGAGVLTVGLLWYDSDTRSSLPAKIGRAAAHYYQKYGRWPNTCHVHPTALDNGGQDTIHVPDSDQAIAVSARPGVLKHHLWIGEAD